MKVDWFDVGLSLVTLIIFAVIAWVCHKTGYFVTFDDAT